jgi:hypothetical protein
MLHLLQVGLHGGAAEVVRGTIVVRRVRRLLRVPSMVLELCRYG